MKGLDDTLELARREHLYPSVIVYGGSEEDRRSAALELARTLLCERRAAERGCDPAAEDACRHCRRIRWPETGQERFHPDLHVLERDLRTSTSIDATRGFLQPAWSTPFEARGQVFVVAEADTLSGGGADTLLKLLEEPPTRTSRHFLLLAASRLDLLPTLRSRSFSLFLGNRESLPEEEVGEVAEALEASLDRHFEAPSPIFLFGAAAALGRAEGWKDPRARRPWAVGAAALLRYVESRDLEPAARRGLLALADDLMTAPGMRVRGIPHGRILEGLVARHLA